MCVCVYIYIYIHRVRVIYISLNMILLSMHYLGSENIASYKSLILNTQQINAFTVCTDLFSEKGPRPVADGAVSSSIRPAGSSPDPGLVCKRRKGQYVDSYVLKCLQS